VSISSIGAYEAKTNLPRLLDQVERGDTVTITKHGRAVARLVPVSSRSSPPEAVIVALRSARVGVRRGGDSVREMIEEGRR
jgi:prevent-host-death family protein